MRIALKVLHHGRRGVEVEFPGAAAPVSLTRCLDVYALPVEDAPARQLSVEIWQDATRSVTLRLSRVRGSGDDWTCHLWA